MTLVTGPQCVVECCTSKSIDGVLLHDFPPGGEEREAWINFVRGTKGPDWVPGKFSVVCAQHFTRDCYENQSTHPTDFQLSEQLLRVSWHWPALKPGAVPTVYPASPAPEDANVLSRFSSPHGDVLHPALQRPYTALQGPYLPLKGTDPALREHHPVLQEHHPVLQERHPVLQEHHPVLQEHHPVLQGPYSVLQGPYFSQPFLGVPGPYTSEAQPHDAVPNLAESGVPGGAADGERKPTQQRRVNLDPAALEERRKARAARDAARRAAMDPAVLEARRQAAAMRRAAKKLELQAARLATQEAHLEKVRREWAEQQHPPLTTEAETMVLGLPGPAHLGQFDQPSITPASTSGRSLNPASLAALTRKADLLRACTRKTDAQTQYTVQVVVKSAQAAVLPKVKSVALQTDNRVMGKNSTGPRKGKRCKLIAPSRTFDSNTSTTSHQATRRRALRSST